MPLFSAASRLYLVYSKYTTCTQLLHFDQTLRPNHVSPRTTRLRQMPLPSRRVFEAYFERNTFVQVDSLRGKFSNFINKHAIITCDPFVLFDHLMFFSRLSLDNLFDEARGKMSSADLPSQSAHQPDERPLREKGFHWHLPHLPVFLSVTPGVR